MIDQRTLGGPEYIITAKDRERQKRIQYAWDAYEGDFPPPLKPMPDEADDNIIENACQPAVDRGVDFLFGDEVEFSLGEDGDEEVLDTLNKIWGEKEKRIPLLLKVAMNGSMAGHAFIRIQPVRDGFRLIALDPCTVFVRTAPQDCETVLLYCIEYASDILVRGRPERVWYREEIKRVDLGNDDPDSMATFSDTDTTWRIQHWTQEGERGKWVAAGEPIIWPYSFPPVFGCQNNPNPRDYWGYPDITRGVIQQNNSLNFNESNINRTNKFYAQPMISANGVGDDDIPIRPGHIINLPALESKINVANIASDQSSALAFSGSLRNSIDEQFGVPGVATGRASMPSGQISGVAIELLFMPLTKKTDKKRCTYGAMMIDVSRALLLLSGYSAEHAITLNWQDPLPHDELAKVSAAQGKKQIGVSNATLMREQGYDPEEEAAKKAEEDEQQQIAFSRGQGMPPDPAGGAEEEQESPFIRRP